MIRFDCPECGKSLKAPDDAAGNDGRCSCGHVFTIPEPLDLEPIPRRRRPPSWLSITAFIASSLVLFYLAFLAFLAGAVRLLKHAKDSEDHRTGKTPYTAADDLIGQGYALYALAALLLFAAIACGVVALIRLGRAARA